MSNIFELLPDYFFEREAFKDCVYSFFTFDDFCELTDKCRAHEVSFDFIYAYSDDTYYIIHKDSGVMVTWYKTLGRANTCNTPSMTLEDLHEFFRMVREDVK